MKHRGLYSALADAAHATREAGRRAELLAQLAGRIAQALDAARPLTQALYAEGDPQAPQMGRVFAYLVDAGELLERLQTQHGTPAPGHARSRAPAPRPAVAAATCRACGVPCGQSAQLCVWCVLAAELLAKVRRESGAT